MKKKMLFFILFFLFSFPLFVYADDYEIQTLIPINTRATVKTDKFIYGDFYYTYVDGNSDGLISFSSITNNTISKTAVSINILLFNEEQKNIGYITYCSDKDFSSNYSGFKLLGNQSAPFSISVVKKYFADGFNASNVKYISVYDENKYCHIGGYDNYKGLTIDQIVNGKTSKKDPFNFSLFELFSSFASFELFSLIVKVICILFFLYILGIFINMLHERMYVKRTIFAFFPIINFFLSMKMSFGKIVSMVYLIISILSCVLYYFGIPILFYIIVILFVVSFFVNLFKFFSKKYDLFIFEPSIKTVGLESNSAFTADVPREKKGFSLFKKKENNSEVLSNSFFNNDNSLNSSQSFSSEKDNILDLSYDENTNFSNTLQSNVNNNDSYNVTIGENNESFTNNQNDSDNSNSSEESDLSKFFH